MFKIIITSALAALLATAASAQSNTDSTSDAASSAENSLVFEGSNPMASSASVGGAMHTAPCIIGHGQAIGLVGGGFANSGGTTEASCLGREEAEWIINLLSMPVGPERTAAIIHVCENIPSIRKTMAEMGICVAPTELAASAPPVSTAYSFCGMVDGVFTVRVPQGGNAELASAQCQASR
jgi:hypothetical protein